MEEASRASKTTGCTSCGGEGRMQFGWGGCPLGCLFARASLTVRELGLFGSTRSARCSTPPSLLSASISSAAPHFPANILLANRRAWD